MPNSAAESVTPAFAKEVLEIDFIASALVGASRQQVGNTITLKPTAQFSVGLQIQKKIKLPGKSGIKLVVGVQVSGSGTAATVDTADVAFQLDVVADAFFLGAHLERVLLRLVTQLQDAGLAANIRPSSTKRMPKPTTKSLNAMDLIGWHPPS